MRPARIGAFLLLLLGLGLSLILSAYTNPVQSQETFVTPTPGPDGRIVYIVETGDDPWTIAALSGITVEQLYALNGMQSGDYIIPGMELVLGFGGPVQATVEPQIAETETPLEPSPTPLFDTGEICVLLFLDENGDARLEENELALAEGRISIVDVSGNLAAEDTTTADIEGQCFEDLASGDYNVSAAVPAGYNPTTSMSLPLRLEAGDVKYIQFGAQPSAAIQGTVSDAERKRSLWFGIFGLLMLAAAAGIGIYASRYGRQIRKLPR